MAEVGSLQVDHSYKRVVESWFPDLFQKEQPKTKVSDAGGRKGDVGKNGRQSESTSGEKPSLKQKKKQTVPMATKIGSLVEGKILPKLKKTQQVHQREQKGNKVPPADSNEGKDEDSKLTSLSQSQRKQPDGQQQGGQQKLSRNQVRRMKRRQRKEQQAAGTQEVPEPVTGQFPTLENLLQSPSKLSQGKVGSIQQTKEKEQQRQEQSLTESPKPEEQTAEAKEDQSSPVTGKKNKRKRFHAMQDQPSPNQPVCSKTDSPALRRTEEAQSRNDSGEKEVSQDATVLVSKKRKRKRRNSKSKEAPSEELKEDTADFKTQVSISPTGDGKQEGDAEGQVSTPGEGKRRRKRRRAKKVVTPEEQEPQEPVEPSPKKPKLQNKPNLPGGAAKQTTDKPSPSGQKTSSAKMEKKKRKTPLVQEQGGEEKTLKTEDTEETPAKKQRLSVEKNEDVDATTADADVQPAGGLKKRKRRRRRKRTTSEQSQSSETEASTAVEPAPKEGDTVSSAEPENQLPAGVSHI
ncbi:hypothetical protein Bbelb_202200 [Branchiostoma belcheri]|nr:hypothetical protein Bbelb_202200 [Branchiostoma belcheri]